jgi:hypothetical protein
MFEALYVKPTSSALIPESKRHNKLLEWAGGMARDGYSVPEITATLVARVETHCEKGGRVIGRDECERAAGYAVQAESSKRSILTVEAG